MSGKARRLKRGLSHGAWEGYHGKYDHCVGTSCYYVCGSDCDIYPE